ncbi:plasmid stability [Synechococcus phage S-SM2]|uniref:Plasmid stability protein n=1 Tax=Synechococcus phage S-SM2 TaxID=444860 RepID=E3SJB5_9CAUD|nr:plasmid stability [Synechococcus phage S-SM2]ADO97563.1 plasmid stability protein [Synechococcus phage S-SM2]
MQKVINVLAVLSFVGTAGIIGGGTVVYLRRDAIIEQVKENVAKAATEAIAGALPGMMDAALPELPGATGGAIPAVPSTTGPAIPSF